MPKRTYYRPEKAGPETTAQRAQRRKARVAAAITEASEDPHPQHRSKKPQQKRQHRNHSRVQKRKTKRITNSSEWLEAQCKTAELHLQQISTMGRRIQQLEDYTRSLETNVDLLEAHSLALYEQLLRAGLKPATLPETARGEAERQKSSNDR